MTFQGLCDRFPGRNISQIRIKDSAITQRIYLIENYDNKSQCECSWTGNGAYCHRNMSD